MEFRRRFAWTSGLVAAVALLSTFPAVCSVKVVASPHDAASSGSRSLRGQPPAIKPVSKDTHALLAASKAKRTKIPGPLFQVRLQGVNLEHVDPAEGLTLVVDTEERTLALRNGWQDGVAQARMVDEMSTNGWSRLEVNAFAGNSKVSNDIRVYSAGYLEGLITAHKLTEFRTNLDDLLAKDPVWPHAERGVRTTLKRQLKRLTEKANFVTGPTAEEPLDPYWKQARFVLGQLWGLRDGYNAAIAHGVLPDVEPLDLIDLLVINSHADLPEMMENHRPKKKSGRGKQRRRQHHHEALLQRDAREGNHSSSAVAKMSIASRVEANQSSWTDDLSDQDWEKRLARRGHCSALVRLAPGASDLLVGHTTWSDYSKMTRVFKYYNFELPGSSAGTHAMAFSSYPGCVSSTDDFYMLDSGLLVMDTTIEVLAPELYDGEMPVRAPIPQFVHLMAVNRFAKSAAHWTQLFAEQNTDAISAQWMIIDFMRFSVNKPLTDDTIRLLEQIPGMTRQTDISSLVAQNGYWASFNRPWFQDVRKRSGHEAAEETYGALFSFEDSPRATLFHRLVPEVATVQGMRELMDRNDFEEDGIEPETPGHAIAARFDLDEHTPIPNGAIDVKVTSSSLFRELQCQAISGPTHEKLKPFRWKKHGEEVFEGWPHEGLPNLWNFGWVQMTPEGMETKLVDALAEPKPQ